MDHWESIEIDSFVLCINFYTLYFFPLKPPIQVFGLEGRYATALYSAASKQKKLDQVEKELTRVLVMWFYIVLLHTISTEDADASPVFTYAVSFLGKNLFSVVCYIKLKGQLKYLDVAL